MRRAFTGAWIETSDLTPRATPYMGRAFTGAWIETSAINVLNGSGKSRAFTGAWIETKHYQRKERGHQVAPSQARGLKHQLKVLIIIDLPEVAPSQARGLKQAPQH